MTPRRLAGASIAAAALLYLSFPAARYNFDGVACAIAVELGDFKHLAHGNHLAYGVLGWAFHFLFRLARVPVPAVVTLQLLSSLLGAAAAGVFAALLLDLGLAPAIAFAGAMGLAVSKIFWVWSLEAQVYPLGTLFLLLAAREALSARRDPVRLGLFHAGAVLGHVGHIMFLPAALYLLKGRKERVRYAAVLGSAVFAAYFFAAFLVRPASLEELRVWLLGSAALAVDRTFGWHGGYSWAGISSWARVSLDAPGGWAAGAALIAAACWGGFAAWKARRHVVAACLAWLGAYAILFLSWEPYTPVYRITDLAPLWLLACLGLERWRRSATVKAVLLGSAVAALGVWNLAFEILPASKPENNRELQRALWESRETPQDAWFVAEGIDQVYLPYFADRKFVNLRYYSGREESLLKRISLLREEKHPVFVVPQALSEPWRKWLQGVKTRKTAESGPWELLRIVS